MIVRQSRSDRQAPVPRVGQAAAFYGILGRHDDRQIVGEIIGPEAWVTLKAMESGRGSLTTTHARNAHAAIAKLVTCAMEAGPVVTRELALAKIVGALDLVIQLDRRLEIDEDGQPRLRRWVREIALVQPGEKDRGYALLHVFGPDRNGPGRATGHLLDPRGIEGSDEMAERIGELVEHGFDPDLYQAEVASGGWMR